MPSHLEEVAGEFLVQSEPRCSIQSPSSFILANTGQLHAKISQLSDRVRELEDALRENCSPDHPLLAPELLQMKTIQEFYGVSSNVLTLQPDPSLRDGENLHQAVNTLSLNTNNEYTKPYMVDVSLR